MRQAATASGYSERTVQRRMADSEFRLEIAKARNDLFQQASGRLTEGLDGAISTLKSLLDSQSDSIRLNAAKSLIDAAMKVAAIAEFEARITALEERTHAAQTISPFKQARIDHRRATGRF